MRLIVVSGLSGSGKSVALHMLEDLGFFCIDNIPIKLFDAFVEQTVRTEDPIYQRTAVGVDARNRPEDLVQLPSLVDGVRASGIDCEILFLHADSGVLLKRYRETRRRHPLSSETVGLKEAIATESELLQSVASHADLVVDTTRSSVHELRDTIRARVAGRNSSSLSLQFQSFGFKNGLPADADIVFDVRCLPNPYWVSRLRGLTGRDEAVAAWLSDQADVNAMLESITAWLDQWIPKFIASNRSYLTVAIGCTGGQHRSVYLVEQLAQHFAGRESPVLIRHSELSG